LLVLEKGCYIQSFLVILPCIYALYTCTQLAHLLYFSLFYLIPYGGFSKF
jgi:hypothetical protein